MFSEDIEIDLSSPEAIARAYVLLRAARDLLRITDASPYVVSAMETAAYWDGVNCDGHALAEEIEELLGLALYTPVLAGEDL